MYKRELRNLLLNNKSKDTDEFLKASSLLILNKKDIDTDTYLYY